jgi:GNAT superfamily N-acetyltransferase
MINQQFPSQTWQQAGFLISTDPAKFEARVIHRYLSEESYWSAGVSLAEVQRRIQYALCFGVYACAETADTQIGFARVISDFTSFAYLCDLFILPEYQNSGLGQWLMSCILAHPELQTIRRWTLYTSTAHKLYARFGFQIEPYPDTFMILRRSQRPELT